MKFKTALSFLQILLINVILIRYIFTGSERINGEIKSANTLTINPINITSYLSNPGIGWQYMGTSDKTKLSETVFYPDRSGISWKLLNPSENNYSWNILDAQINQAISSGKQISFRIYTMRSVDLGGHQVPDWVLNKGAVILPSGEVDYSNCIYQDEWTKFVEQLRARYDGNANIAYIDISGYGNFNEWSWQDQTELDADQYNPATIDGQARKRLADVYIGGNDNLHQCKDSLGSTVSSSYTYTGFQKTQLLMPYAGIRQSSYYVANRRTDIGFRHDCLGRIGSEVTLFQTNLGGILDDLWKTAPVAYELCAIDWNDPGFLSRADELLRYSHGSLVHDNPSGLPENLENMTQLIKNTGYRYYLKSAVLPSSAIINSSFNVQMIWQNIGYAPSYPKMGQSFSLYLYLLNSNNQEVKQWKLNSDIKNWQPANTLPGTALENNISQSLSLSNLSAGNYKFAVNIIDERTGKPINLSFTGDIIGSNSLGSMKYYILNDLNITNATNSTSITVISNENSSSINTSTNSSAETSSTSTSSESSQTTISSSSNSGAISSQVSNMNVKNSSSQIRWAIITIFILFAGVLLLKKLRSK